MTLSEFGNEMDYVVRAMTESPSFGDFSFLPREQQEAIVNKVCDEIEAMDVVFEPCEDGIGLHPVFYPKKGNE